MLTLARCAAGAFAFSMCVGIVLFELAFLLYIQSASRGVGHLWREQRIFLHWRLYSSKCKLKLFPCIIQQR